MIGNLNKNKIKMNNKIKICLIIQKILLMLCNRWKYLIKKLMKKLLKNLKLIQKNQKIIKISKKIKKNKERC